MLSQIVPSVFETMMSLAVSPGKTEWFPAADRLTSSVHLAGDWTGVVLLECDRRQACQFTGRFLSLEPPDIVDDDVRDVLGELANMIGGNMKCVMSPGTVLSMPMVTDGGDYGVRICRSEVQNRLAFQCEEGNFWVTMLATKPQRE